MEVSKNRLSRDEWEKAADQADAMIQQRWIYGEACQAMGREIVRYSLHSNGETIALAQVIVRSIGRVLSVATVFSGPITVDGLSPAVRSDAIAAIKREIAKTSRLLMLTGPPEDQREPASQGLRKIMSPVTVAVLPLDEDPLRMRARMNVKWRNRLKSADTSELKISPTAISQSRIDWLVKKEVEQRKTRRYSGLPLHFISSLVVSRPKQAKLYLAKVRNEPVAAMLFLRHGTTATYLVGWSGAEGRKSSAHNVILWRAMCDLAELGAKSIDLGTINTHDAPGLARFKLGAGARAMPNSGTLLGLSKAVARLA